MSEKRTIDMTREEEIRERCEEAVKMLRGLLPEKVDYADLVCAEGFARGFNYVWTDPEPYAMDEAANCIEALLTENARMRAELEAASDSECDKCRFKLRSEAWKYYRYPCSECRRRTKDHFAEAEAIAAMEEDAHG